jgi:hypothetical protein
MLAVEMCYEFVSSDDEEIASAMIVCIITLLTYAILIVAGKKADICTK